MYVQTEVRVLALGGIVLLVLFFLAITHARAQVRDDLRQTDVTNLKRALEMYNNEHNMYPEPPGGQPACTSSSDPTSWFFGDESPLLQEQQIDAIPHDTREYRGRVYRYCATGPVQQLGAGYFLEAELEIDQEDAVAFDEDERRKFYYRVLHDEVGRTLYRICGGTETQCTPS